MRSDVLARTALAIVAAGIDAWIEDPQPRDIGRSVDDAAWFALGGTAPADPGR